jgi:hypothetical protein
MDDVSLASAFIAARMGEVQLAAAAKLMRMNAEGARSAGEIIEAAQQNIDRLANVAAGIGTTVDISA